ncbi:MAG: NBR1-Ig-like domain-containing protein [Anaerolineaceae bacterium]|nr:NBR1-Ig-like domain-containing protein [Anaerolineaceae bacterium]
MRKLSTTISFILLSTMLLSACSLGVLPTSQSQDLAPMNTAQAKTIVALSVQLTEAAPQATQPLQATSAATQLSQSTAAASNTPVPSDTPAATDTQVPTASLTPVGSVPNVQITQVAPLPCDRFDFVSDITVGDYTNFNPGATFTKTWRLRNSGTCTWDSSYKLVYDSGYSLSGPASVALPGTVAPGQLVDVSVTLQAPYNIGTYRGFWKLQDPSGVRFGYGSGSASPVWVLITVGATPYYIYTSTPQVSGGCSLESISPPAYTQYAKGGDFDSKWVIKNTSGKTWSSADVDFEYISGTKMYTKKSIYDLANDVTKNSKITFIIDSKAPSSNGTYTMTWGLVSGSTNLCYMSVTIIVK